MDERIALMHNDPAVDLSVDGNAVGGLLAAVFGAEMTANPGRCASCRTTTMVGAMRVYMRGPGIVVRCPACAEVILRIAHTPQGTIVDARGAAYLVVDAG